MLSILTRNLNELKKVHSLSRPGLSVVYVDIQEHFWGDELNQIWDKLRRRINDTQSKLPPQAMKSMVEDDFGDVFGVLLAISSEDFPPAELKDQAEKLRQKMLMLDDVAKCRTRISSLPENTPTSHSSKKNYGDGDGGFADYRCLWLWFR